MHNSNRVTFLDTHSAPRYNLAAPLANRDLPTPASTLRWPYHLRLYYAAKSAPRKHATPKQHPLVLLHQPLGRHQPLVEHLVYFLAQFCLKLGNALAVIFLRWGKGGRLDPRAGIFLVARNCSDHRRIVTIWARKYKSLGCTKIRYLLACCLPLFDLFVLLRKIDPSGNPDFGQGKSKKKNKCSTKHQPLQILAGPLPPREVPSGK